MNAAAKLLQIAKLDWLVWMTSLVGTIFLGISTGLAIAIGMALLFVIYESAYPHTAMLGKLPHTNVYRSVFMPSLSPHILPLHLPGPQSDLIKPCQSLKSSRLQRLNCGVDHIYHICTDK